MKTNKITSKRQPNPTYADCVLWIADNDNAGSEQPVPTFEANLELADVCSGYVTSCMVAHLFGVDPFEVGKHVMSARGCQGLGDVTFERQLRLARNKLESQ